MGSKNRYDGVLSSYAINLIRSVAMNITRHKGFSSSDQDDLEQELVLHLLERLPKYDASKASLDTFINRVVYHIATSLVRARQTQKRGVDVTVHLEDPVGLPGEENQILLDVIDPEDLGLKNGTLSRSTEDQYLLQIDTEMLLNALPPDLRALCHMLAEDSVAEVAKSLGRHRTTIYKNVQTIHKDLEKKRLGDPR